MPVNLVNVYSTRNLGDAAIISGLIKMAPDRRALARVPDRDPLPIAGLVRAAKLDPAHPFVSVGGDIFNNARPAFVTRRFLGNVCELAARGRRAAMFGQSIPRSCRGPSFGLLSACLRRAARVVVRDEESWRRLRAARVDVRLSHDAAFALEAKGGDDRLGQEVLRSFGLDPARAALLSLRGFGAMYPQDDARFMRAIVEVIHKLSARGHQCGLVVQADADGEDSDLALCGKLSEDGLPIRVVDLVGRSSTDPVGDMIATLGAANIVIAVRYHSAVLRLIAGRRPVVLSYSNKTRDLIDRLGVEGVDIGSIDPDEIVSMAEASASRWFQPAAPRASVLHEFEDAIAATGGWAPC